MDNFSVLSIDNFNTRFPILNEEFINSLDKLEQELYLQIYSVYSYIFRKYIIKILNLKEYDNQLLNSNLKYIMVKEENMDIYQDFTKSDLNYFYLRNNLYVERLSLEEKEFLYKIYIGKINPNDIEIEKFIMNTYKKVIFEDITNDGNLVNVNYGPNSNKYYMPNNSLVIGVRYDQFNLNGMSDEEWDKLYQNQIYNLIDLIENMKEKIKNKLDVPIHIVQYDEYSVKKKDFNLNDTDSMIIIR